jgi:Transglycosylase-like domain
MRNHRLFGTFIAVLLGTSLLHPRPSSPQGHHHQVSGSHISGASVKLASAALPADRRYAFPTDGGAPVGLLRPAGARYLEAVWAWSAYVAAHAPPPPTRPTPAQPATFHAATPAAPATQTAADEGSPTDLLRPAGARYLEAVWAWSAYVAAHAPPPPPRPTPVQPATFHAATPVVPATRAAVGDVWAGLRRCESGGNYAENTGNGYYGAYQFSAATWHGLGLPGLPSDAAPAVQDRAAQQLQARSGWGQWPSCSRLLRLA